MVFREGFLQSIAPKSSTKIATSDESYSFSRSSTILVPRRVLYGIFRISCTETSFYCRSLRSAAELSTKMM